MSKESSRLEKSMYILSPVLNAIKRIMIQKMFEDKHHLLCVSRRLRKYTLTLKVNKPHRRT